MAEIQIKDRKIGNGHKPYVICEIAQAHDGSLGFAHSFIDAAAEAGVDAIKFQTHIAAAESSKDEKFRIQMSGQDATRYDYWKRMEFTEEQWYALAKHAADKNIGFLSSAFSVQAVELLAKMGMPAWKVGSGEFRSKDLLAAMLKAGGPILYSTGMSTYDEVDSVVNWLRSEKADFGIFQCTSYYPTVFEKVGLNVLDQYAERYECVVGLSDHSGTIYPSLAAMAKGSHMIEVHATFDKRMYGPDAIASVTFAELKTICDARDHFFTMEQHPVNKDVMAVEMQQMRDLFTKSIALSQPLGAGTLLTEGMLTPKKPGTGIPYQDMSKVLGKKLKHDVPSDRLLRWEDIEDAA